MDADEPRLAGTVRGVVGVALKCAGSSLVEAFEVVGGWTESTSTTSASYAFLDDGVESLFIELFEL